MSRDVALRAYFNRFGGFAKRAVKSHIARNELQQPTAHPTKSLSASGRAAARPLFGRIVLDETSRQETDVPPHGPTHHLAWINATTK